MQFIYESDEVQYQMPFDSPENVCLNRNRYQYIYIASVDREFQVSLLSKTYSWRNRAGLWKTSC